MSLVHDLVKTKLVREGYLPNYPYHLISDAEMCDAFLNDSDMSYFHINYPCLSPQLQEAYDELISAMCYHINLLKSSKDDMYELPDWIYSYMIGSAVGPNSEILDIHDILVPMGLDNLDDIFTAEASAECLKVSRDWLKKLPQAKLDHRPPTMFGEPHVIKNLRLREVDVLGR